MFRIAKLNVCFPDGYVKVEKTKGGGSLKAIRIMILEIKERGKICSTFEVKWQNNFL